MKPATAWIAGSLFALVLGQAGLHWYDWQFIALVGIAVAYAWAVNSGKPKSPVK